MAEIDPAVSAALARMEATGKLEGVEFEHYVGGGLPPPYYHSEQLRLIARDGRDTIEFAKANFSSKPAKDTPYPRDVYQLVAQAEDVKSLARVLRAGRAFDVAAPTVQIADSVRIELVLTVGGKPHKAIYQGLPPALEPLDTLVDAFIARAKSQGRHKLEP